MSVTAKSVLTQIEATIVAVTPTELAHVKYRLITDDAEAPVDEQALTSGVERTFSVDYGAGSTGEYNHPAEFECQQVFAISVLYPAMSPVRTLRVRMRQDVNDLKKALDNPTNWAASVTHQALFDWEEPRAIDDAFVQVMRLDVRFLEASQ